MDTGRAAKFPFLKESAEFAEQNNADLEALITSPSFEPARERGVARVMDALESSEVTYKPLMNDYDRLIEVMSYPYARMIVSMVGDRFLTKRYALAEAVRMNKILTGEDRETLLVVSEELGVTSTVDADGIIRMGFPDYLRLANRLKSVDWKLINCDIHSGLVYLPQEKFSRLMQNALQDKIESELPLMTPEEYRRYLRGAVDKVSMALEEAKARYSPTGGEGMKNEFLPPCLVHILDMSRRGMNLPHSARFALVTFLHALGLDYDGIIRVFSEQPAGVQDHEDERPLPQPGHSVPAGVDEPSPLVLQGQDARRREEERAGRPTTGAATGAVRKPAEKRLMKPSKKGQ